MVLRAASGLLSLSIGGFCATLVVRSKLFVEKRYQVRTQVRTDGGCIQGDYVIAIEFECGGCGIIDIDMGFWGYDEIA